MFAIDDPQNQFLADFYGVVMGTRYGFFFLFRMAADLAARSHQEPMMRSTPNEFSYLGLGSWDYTKNADVINNYWKQGAERAKPYESVYTMGMRGFGDCTFSVFKYIGSTSPYFLVPLSEDTNIALLEGVINNQTLILQDVYGTQNVSDIPQIWALC